MVGNAKNVGCRARTCRAHYLLGRDHLRF